MHISIALALAVCFRIVAANPAVPRLGPSKEGPNVPGGGRPQSPNNPETPGGTNWEPDTPSTQQNIEMNMGNTEKRLDEFLAKGTEMVVSMFANGTEDIVSAMLETPSCTWKATTTASGKLVGGFPQVDEYDECSSAKFTPKTTLPTTSFEYCTSYASILSSCASATTSFYSLDASAQASCACYSTPNRLTMDCIGATKEQRTAAPTLAPKQFDNVAFLCHSYFSQQGYENVAKMLSGWDGNKTRLGINFCASVDADLKRQSGNASLGLRPQLSETEFTYYCVEYFQPGEGRQTVANGAPLGYAAFKEAGMVAGFVLIAVVPLLVL